MIRRLRGDLRQMMAEQFEYRELLYQMTLRDLLLRYKQSIMGFGWAVFTPVVNTIVFSIIFTKVARIETNVPYPVFAYCGLLAWTFFASSLRFSVNSLTSNANLVAKVYFPREIFPFSTIVVSLVDFAVGGTILAALMLYYRIPLTPAALALPVIVLVQIAFTAGVALLLSMANLFYRDVKYLFEIVITVWMFGTSVLYPTQLTGRFALLLELDPMTPILDAYRAVLLEGRLPDPGPFALATVLSFLTLSVGWVFFHRMESEFAENV